MMSKIFILALVALAVVEAFPRAHHQSTDEQEDGNKTNKPHQFHNHQTHHEKPAMEESTTVSSTTLSSSTASPRFFFGGLPFSFPTFPPFSFPFFTTAAPATTTTTTLAPVGR